MFIPDADPEAFGEFLRFIYTEDCSVTEENVMSIVYLATKYIVPALTSKCVKFLGKKVTAESAFELLSQAIHFCADGLEASCWNVIDVDCSNAIKSPAFLKIEHALLCEFLTRETLNVKEVDLFTAIIKWAQFQCESKELEESVENYREVLGSALNLVRFPTMALEEFASTVVHESKILLQEDIIEIFMQFSGQQPKDTRLPKFSCKPRKHCVGNLRATRFSPQKIIRPKRAGKGWCYMNNTLDALCFKTSRSVKMHGVRAFGDDEKSTYRLKVNLLQGNRELSANAGEFKSEGDENDDNPIGFDIMFPEPVRLEANVVYTLTGSFSGPQSFYGQGGEKVVIADGVEFTFCSSEQSNNGTSVFHGQFPQLIFSK